eukprot:Protomagalhaensia_wolfi_Nauph_80__505@NODE_1285_length_1612_cov_214_520025_g992_i0_p1_GENE_NODE_1285_length_1612_cov_214_520025_g992_i0NODE_1285_length_1612_cov_214_520025_g992_i0_p1_ORF_typecomplete_len101_score15_09Ysc84/PF04366_12/2_3e03Ysc84/PF04366_12/0_16TadZ_N/PF16968_5/0_14_NODE_1285_length_1612_cov_214_520025_g992_i069371
MGKAFLRGPVGVPTEAESLESVSPTLHPAYYTRSYLSNILPNYVPWPKRAEWLYEALRSGKIVVAEAQASPEAFVARLALFGVIFYQTRSIEQELFWLNY